AEIFLDDVTVSRNHAMLVRRADGVYIDDLGSLNGTYVNRRRIESHRLADGDELQVGQFKLTFLDRWDESEPDNRGARTAPRDRRGVRRAEAPVPGHLDLEDPLPRGPEAPR